MYKEEREGIHKNRRSQRWIIFTIKVF